MGSNLKRRLVALIGFDRLPRWAVAAGAPASVVGITLVLFFTHLPASPLVILYVPVVVSAFYFYGRAWAVLQNVLIGAGYGAVLVVDRPEGALAWWILTIGILALAGGLMGRVRDRIQSLVTELEQTARTDPLTGLLNRRTFDRELDMELERSRRAARPVSLMIGDLDHFKLVNDKEGHQAGDSALRILSDIFAEHARRVDMAARMGGEEFALVLPGTDEAGAYMLAERIRRKVSEHFEGKPVRLTISLGIASYPAHGYEVEPLMKAADHALYTAKALGRDRTVICNRAIASALASETDLERPLAPGEDQAAA